MAPQVPFEPDPLARRSGCPVSSAGTTFFYSDPDREKKSTLIIEPLVRDQMEILTAPDAGGHSAAIRELGRSGSEVARWFLCSLLFNPLLREESWQAAARELAPALRVDDALYRYVSKIAFSTAEAPRALTVNIAIASTMLESIALAEIPRSKKIVTFVRALLSGTLHDRARISCLFALAPLYPRRVEPALRKFLTHRSPRVAEYARKSLSHLFP